MKFYFAPLEGLTGYIYRNAHNKIFNSNHGIAKYFAPFITANQSESFKTRDINDILPEHNRGLYVVPQLLTNNSQDFIQTSKRIYQLGYNEIDLNLGCPSGTVVAKNKGAGFLSLRDELDAFLDDIFSASITEISIKTRIGKEEPEEFYDLIKIFNQYPIKELIIHPRIQKDMYKNKPNLEIFKEALLLSKNPVCYNGDIFTAGDYKKFTVDFPDVGTIMIGRGLISNPGLICDVESGIKPNKIVLREFHDEIFQGYQGTLSGDRNVLYKMKEIWAYMITLFSDNAKYAKRIKKAERLRDYEEAVSSLFRDRDIILPSDQIRPA